MIVHDEAALCLHRRPAALPSLVYVGVSGLNVTTLLSQICQSQSQSLH